MTVEMVLREQFAKDPQLAAIPRKVSESPETDRAREGARRWAERREGLKSGPSSPGGGRFRSKSVAMFRRWAGHWAHGEAAPARDCRHAATYPWYPPDCVGFIEVLKGRHEGDVRQ